MSCTLREGGGVGFRGKMWGKWAFFTNQIFKTSIVDILTLFCEKVSIIKLFFFENVTFYKILTMFIHDPKSKLFDKINFFTNFNRKLILDKISFLKFSQIFHFFWS